MRWKEKNISKAEKGVIIKTVAQAIPTYSMSMFKIPKMVCDDINLPLANIGGAKLEMRKKFTGSNGVNCANRKVEVEWGLETFMPSILLC